MDLEYIKAIVSMMKDSELTEFEIEEENSKLRISRKGEMPMAAPPPVMMPAAPAASVPAGDAGRPQLAAAEDPALLIRSPMVGTFYRAPSPESPVFVDKGARVTTDTTVCIIEAMKVMNEIQAEVSGEIAEILVDNGEPVEYGQPLFKLKG